MHNLIFNVRFHFITVQSVFLDQQAKAQNLGSLTRKLYVDIKNGLNISIRCMHRPLRANRDCLYKIGLIQLETERRFLKWSQTWNSDFKWVCRPLFPVFWDTLNISYKIKLVTTQMVNYLGHFISFKPGTSILFYLTNNNSFKNNFDLKSLQIVFHLQFW